MLIYLASENNQDRFSFLKETFMMNTEVKARLNQDTFMKCIKKELRNLEINCLIFDLQIFDREEIIDFRQAIDVFRLLNPDCIIVTFKDECDMTDHMLSLHQCPDIHILDSNVSSVEIIDIINGVNIEQNTVLDDIPDDIPDMENKTEEKVIKDEECIESFEDLTDHKILQSDNIYNKAAVPVKLSEGEPLRKKAKKLPEDKEGDRSEMMKLSAKVKRIQKYSENTLPDPASANESWSCSNIMIGILGTERRTGTTSAALHLASYLRDQGAAVIYTEANKHGHLEDIAAGYNLTRADDHFIYNNVLYYKDSQFDQNAGVNFIVFDLGCIEEDKQRKEKILKEIMNEIIIVSGCKPYEQRALKQTFLTIGTEDATVLFNLSSQAEIEHLQKAYKDCAKYIAAAPFEPELMLPGCWPDDFIKLFQQYRLKQQAVS